MNILVMTLQDSGGGAGKLARAIAEHPDHQVKAARWRKGKTVYYPDSEKYCKWQPRKDWVMAAIKWCDAIITTGPWHSLPRSLPWGTKSLIPPGAPSRRLVVNYRGTPYRNNRAAFNQRDRSSGIVQSTNFLDLCTKRNGGIRNWLPVPVWEEDLIPYRKPHGTDTFMVTQAVTQRKRWDKKHTQQVVGALHDAPGITLDIITGVPHEECMERMGQTDLVVTAFKNGFGNTGLEALAMGIPIVGNGFDELVDLYREKVGFLPFVRATLNDLRKSVIRLRDDGESYKVALRRGRDYLATWHNPRVVAERVAKLCGMAKKGK